MDFMSVRATIGLREAFSRSLFFASLGVAVVLTAGAGGG
jgi:hypothetical protein